LADGAGSAALADLGAQVAVDSIIAYASQAPIASDSDFAALLHRAVMHARDCVFAEATRLATDPRSLASTLLTVILAPSRGAAAQIGDGVIAVSEGDSEWSWVFWPQRGEYVNTTRFLTDDDATTHIEVDTFSRPISGLALTSDGLESLALRYADKAVHQPFFTGLLKPLIEADGVGEIYALSAALQRFVGSPRVTDRTDDDVSLVLATRQKG
jgi:serine/threonine protein phosphatase PrpC